MNDKELVLKQMGLTDIVEGILRYKVCHLEGPGLYNIYTGYIGEVTITSKEIHIDNILILEIDRIEGQVIEDIDDFISTDYIRIGHLDPSKNTFFDGHLIAVIKKGE